MTPTLAKAEGIGTILDAGPAITISDARVSEPVAGDAPARFDITLSAPAQETVVVHFATTDIGGSATPGSDYTSTSRDVVFFAGDPATKTVEVPVHADSLVEAEETFAVQLSQPSGGVIADGDGTGTIVDTPPEVPPVLPTLRVDDAAPVPEPSTGTAPATFDVALSQAPAAPVTVHYATADGTATGADYEATSGILEFRPGGPARLPVQVPVRADAVSPEPDETFTLTLSDPTGATLARPQAVATIVDTVPERPPVHTYECTAAADITTNSATLRATTSDAGVDGATFSLSRNGTLVATLAAAGTTSFGAAASGLEPGATYTYTVSFDPGAHAQTNAPCEFATEPDRRVPSKVSVADARRSEPAGAGTEAPMAFTVSLDTASSAPVVVRYGTIQDANATDGADYVGGSGDVFFAPNEVTKTVPVAIRGDNQVEPDETFTLRLSDPAGADIADGDATGTIVDTPPDPPKLRIDDISVTEPLAGTAPGRFSVSLDKSPTAAAVTVPYVTADGTATEGSDYRFREGTLVFEVGTTTLTQSVDVDVLADSDGTEGDETFTLNLARVTGATVARDHSTATIVDNPPDDEEAEDPSYDCVEATDVTATSATLWATTTDATVNRATFRLTTGATPVATIAKDGPGPYATLVGDLVPATAYSYTASFDPGAHPQGGPACGFTTAAADLGPVDPGSRPLIPTPGASPLPAVLPLVVAPPPPPPAPVPQPLTQAQSVNQAQSQSQAQSQAQAQAQSQAQSQTQAQTAGAGAAAAAPQAQAQGASQAAASDERQREREVQTAKISEAGQTHMASARQTSPVPTGALGGIAGAMALIAGLAFSRRRQPTAAPQRVLTARRAHSRTGRRRRR